MKVFKIFSFASKQTQLYDLVKVKICKRYNIAQTAFDIVMFLHNNPQYNTAKDICKERGIKSGIVSVEVERLLQNGYIVKKTDGIDRRKQRLYLTDKTKYIVSDGVKMQSEFHKKLLDGLSEEEISIYYKALNKIFNNMSKIEREGVDFE